MAVTKERKVEIFNELVAKIKGAKSIGFAATSTITVEEFATLRKSLREVNATYTLAKKTIMKKALKEALGIDVELSDLQGQIGMVCSNEDAIAGLGKVNTFMKEVNGPKGNLGKMEWSISIMDGEVKSAEDTKVLAAMPSRETLLGRLVGSMKSPISALARFFDAASKEVEKQGKNTVGELEKGAAPIAEVPKKEEPKPEVKAEPIAAAETEDTQPEVSVKEEATSEATTTEEAPVETTETPTEEVSSTEIPEEKKEEKAAE